MEHLQTFNENKKEYSTKEEILEYLEKEYPESWWNEFLQDNVANYIDEDDIIDGGFEDEEDAYLNLATGGAIEYDALSEINDDLIEKFNIDSDDFYSDEYGYSDIVNDYMMDTIDWYDSFVFTRSDEEYVSEFEKLFGKNKLGENWD